MQKISITSEIGALKTVLLHRPEISLTRLTPSNCQELLFDDVLLPEEAFSEHLEFAKALKTEGVEVLFLADLLAEVISNENAKNWLLDQHCSIYRLGPMLAKQTKDYIRHFDDYKLIETLIGGLALCDIEPEVFKKDFSSIVSSNLKENGFILNPLPGHLFTRDASCWIHDGVVLSPMQKSARKMETVNLKAVYNFHPKFKSRNMKVWFGEMEIDYSSATVEGGDILVLSKEKILIGYSERTTLVGIENLALNLLKNSEVNEVIVVKLPNKRATMHLDTVLSMVDTDKFCGYQDVINNDTEHWSLTLDKNYQIKFDSQNDFFKTLARITNNYTVQMIPTGGDVFVAEQEQWNDAVNVLTIKPGTVICYDKNFNTIENLQKNDIHVIGIKGNELSKGRGGTRCMSCPIEREDIA